MWYVCDVMYAVLYVRVSCFVVRGCDVSRRYINVCNCDIFSVVNVYIDHLKFCVVCINGRKYVCCSECNVVSNECNEHTHALCNLSVMISACVSRISSLRSCDVIVVPYLDAVVAVTVIRVLLFG